MAFSCSGKRPSHDPTSGNDAARASEGVEVETVPASSDDMSPADAASIPSGFSMDTGVSFVIPIDADSDASGEVDAPLVPVVLQDASSADAALQAELARDAGDDGASAEASAVAHDATTDGPSLVDASQPDAGHVCAERMPDYLAALEWAQWPMPNPSHEAAAGAPHAPRYTTQPDETVNDEVTGLRWQRSSSGASRYTWDEAQRYCRELSIPSVCGWRLPTRIEMLSILDPSRFNPAVDPVFATESTGWTWTSTVTVNQAGMAWLSNEGSTLVNTLPTSFTAAVRCVSSAPGPVLALHERYTVTRDSAYDKQTGLTWDRYASPESSWLEAKRHCAALTPSGWRLPTVKELVTLADMTRPQVALDVALFSGLPGIYWSSTDEAQFSPGQLAHVVNFVDGSIGGEYTGRTAQVRCVRTGLDTLAMFR